MRIIDRIIPPRYPQLVQLDRVYNGDDPADVLILGDSVMERVARDDTDTRTLGQMIADGLKPEHSSVVISNTGYQPSIYYPLLLALSVMEHRPKVVVYPINLRCFSPQWDLHPAWQYYREMRVIWQYIATRKIGRVKRVGTYYMDAYRDTCVAYPSSVLKTVGEFLDIINTKSVNAEQGKYRKKEIFTFHYMHPLVPALGKLQAIQASMSWARSNDVNVLAYVTPINVQAGERFVGPAFRSQVAANLHVLGDAIDHYRDKYTMRIFDWSTEFDSSIDSSHFFDADLSTEHLNQRGRHELGAMVASEARNLLE
jgi:hypothetical protein